MFSDRVTIACVSAFLMLGACASGPTPEQIAQQKAAAFAKASSQAEYSIRGILSAQETAWNAGDIDGYMKHYLPSDNLRFASGDKITWGFEDTLKGYKARYDTSEKMGRLALEVQEFKLFNETEAMVFGRWYLARPQAGDAGGLFTLIFEKINGQWVIVSDHTS